jgi:hypothetical protein
MLSSFPLWMEVSWKDLLALSVTSAVLCLSLVLYYGRDLRIAGMDADVLHVKQVYILGFFASLGLAIFTIEWTVRTIEPVRSDLVLTAVHIPAALAMLCAFVSLLRYTGLTHKRFHAPVAYLATAAFLFVLVTGWYMMQTYP